MIDASAAAVMNRQELVPAEPHFHLDPPGGGPLVVTGPVDFIRGADQVRVTWADTQPYGVERESVSEVLKDMIERSRRDVTRNPSSVRPRVDLGLALLRAGQLIEAAREFGGALALEPEQNVALANLARVRVLQGALDEAETLYTKLREVAPNEPGALMSLAFIAARRDRWDEAITLLKEACQLDEGAALPRYNLARVYLSQGRKREAIAELKAASRCEVRSPEFHYGLGVAYALADELGRAAKSFQAALTLSPTMIEAVHGLSVVLLASGKSPQAVDLLASHLARRPLDREGHELLARAHFDGGRFRAARAQLFEALKLIRDTGDKTTLDRARITNNLGVCAGCLGEGSQAEELLRNSIDLRPDAHPIPYHNLARFYLAKENVRKAREILEECVRLFPEDLATRVLVAIALERQGLYDEAIEGLSEVIRSKKAPAAAFSILGALIADERRDLDGALEVMEEGHALFPHNALIVNNLAYVRLRRGEAGPARRVLGRLSEDQAADVVPTATRGLLLLTEGDIEGGREKYLEAERTARLQGNDRLANVVRQKMHLELARAHFHKGQRESALREVRRGLRIKGRKSFQVDLGALEDEVAGSGNP